MSEVEKLREAFVELWNEERLDEIGEAFYAEDALILPPGHEPVRGRDQIVDFLKEFLRQIGGKTEFGVIETVTDVNLAYAAGTFAVPHLGLKGTTLETYRRLADGTWKCVVDMWHPSQGE